MVARVVTIQAAGDQVDQVLGYYAGLAADQLDRTGGTSRGPMDYYLDPNEPPGRWWGTGCPALGLEVGGPVLPEQLRALLEARHPADGRRLGRGFGDRSARGFDATFSAPKSVSVLWGLTEDSWVRAEITAAQDAAVDAALAWVERHGLVTRRGYRGVHQVDARGLAVGVFRQHTSRTADPRRRRAPRPSRPPRASSRRGALPSAQPVRPCSVLHRQDRSVATPLGHG